MITRKRWTDEENGVFLEMYNTIRDDPQNRTADEIFDFMAELKPFKGIRTAAGLKRHYAHLAEEAKGKPKMTGELEGFLQDIHNIQHAYESTLAENQRLKKRVAELEAKEADFDAMAMAMEAAKRFIAGEQQGRTRFKMDQNGNLERV